MDKIKKPIKKPTKQIFQIRKQVLEEMLVDYGQKTGNNTEKIELLNKKLAKLTERGFA